MRLTGIRLAGFKTFVDPTKVSFLGNRSAVVGPNGCGKSNIIDAVRWVIGESSARRLRGESSTDVIFEGSSARPATAMASVELTFDNADGRVGGQYARFGEISIRREVQRTGQSAYFLNGTRCRRRDIVDVFLGTGFGSRSYSIIEQGMISELVAAKPDDLRAFLEEAAGISRYKERRRETESRMKVTRENLDRLEDIRAELSTRLEHLQRQARAAERYRDLQAERRLRSGQLALLRMRAVDEQLAGSEVAIVRLDTAHRKEVGNVRRLDAELEQARIGHQERTDALNGIQGHVFRVEADIVRTEEALHHHRKQVAHLRAELEDAERRAAESATQFAADEREIDGLEASLAKHGPALAEAGREDAAAATELAEAERAMAAWQADWDAGNARASQGEREFTVAANGAEHLEQGVAALRRRLEELAAEPGTPGTSGTSGNDAADLGNLAAAVTEAQQHHDGLESALERCLQDLSTAREALEGSAGAADAARAALERLEREIVTLEAVQAAALGGANGESGHWMEMRGLADAPRLGEGLVVARGWETAAEAVLGGHLHAARVDDTERFADALGELRGGRVGLYEGAAVEAEARSLPAFATLVSTEHGPVGALLAGVFAADSMEAALAARRELAPGESIVTRDGVWMGSDWMRLDRGEDRTVGVVRRAAELERLGAEAGTARQRLAECEASCARARRRSARLEAERERLLREGRQAADALAALRAEREVSRVRIEEARTRWQRLERERAEARAHIAEDTARLAAARSRLEELSAAVGAMQADRDELGARRERVAERLDRARTVASTSRDRVHQLNLEQLRLTSALGAAHSARERLRTRQAELAGRERDLRRSIRENLAPVPDLEGALQQKLAERVTVRKEQAGVQRSLEAAEGEIAALARRQREAAAAVEAARDRVEQARVQREGIAVQRRTFEDQLRQVGLAVDEVAAGLPEDAREEAWVEILERIERRIARLGAINLAAIEEFEAESERKRFLDAEHEDIEKALATLQSAIGRIDRETRTRFQATFDEVNGHLKTLFPKLFGGGRASLELTGDNLLDTGVRLMARPPGKRNSNVHMLSGGEKALAAIALVFAIFQLNPSPVCLLDEVDAPLDDSNVARFAELLHEMSKDVQFVVITHNKLTMEMADHLLGVTMNEPGVSRLVSVDVEEAVAMAVV